MGYATIVSLEAFKQAHERSGIRQQLHEHFDCWLDRVEEQMKGKPPTLEQMTEAVFTLRQELTGRVTEVLVGEVHRETLVQQTLPCPQCGRRLHAQGPHPRMVETRVGPVHLSRPYFYCLRCQGGSMRWMKPCNWPSVGNNGTCRRPRLVWRPRYPTRRRVSCLRA